jgi:hypothetical protein
MRNGLLALAALGLAGCPSKVVRPPTAVEYCERLRASFEGKTECAPVTAADRLALMHAVEAAVLMRRGPDPAVPGTEKLTDIGWVAYTEEHRQPTMGALLQMMGRELAGMALLEEHNDLAHVGLYVVRGEISADGWARLSKAVRALQPRGEP